MQWASTHVGSCGKDGGEAIARVASRARVARDGVVEQPHRLLTRGLHHLAVHVTHVTRFDTVTLDTHAHTTQ